MDIHESNLNTRCVIYDCDGVLFDSLEANGRLYSEVCISMGRPPLSEDELHYVHSHTVFEAIHFISKNDSDLEEKALQLLKQIDLRKYVVYLKMEPHLLETLGRLKEREILKAVNTNRTTSMKYIMEEFDLWPYFDMVVTALDVKNPKPHPESVEKILETFNLRKEEALFVGDSEVDQQAARASDVRFVAYKNRSIANELFIEDHLELLKIL
ncbi:MAG TPA: HAD-IA family hydrolase [Thermodesulfobacteriota bacterium]|nr:HAD-IA family hydrolase [Thermodesulfobacteriota bacterium]